jgi:hypothetical protein
MNISSFNISISKIEAILKEFELFKMNGIHSINERGVSSEFKSATIKETYFKAYNVGLANYDFDFLTNDQSFFQFEFHINDQKTEIRFSFFQNPVDFISYNDYLLQLIEEHHLVETVDEVRGLFEDEYDQFLNEQENISNYTTFRYDLDQDNYLPVVHSFSHIHVGHQNNIRIPINKVISPLKFVLFVIKNVYYLKWKNKMENNPDFILSALKDARVHQADLNNKFWKEEEKLELHMN